MPVAKAQAAESSPFSDDALALRFSELHFPDSRYTEKLKQWFVWDDCRWRHDDILSVFDKARRLCRVAAEECSDKGASKQVRSAATISAVERLARSDPRHAVSVEQWDADPWKLNTPAGTVDLKTGKINDHDRDDYITKLAAVGPGGTGCPEWRKFLDRVTGGDRELQAFLARIAGYALTGKTDEHAFFFFWGTGANGKSTFTNTLSGLMQQYAITCPMETFTAHAGERHPTDIAGLKGARLVVANETSEGQRWDEAKLKALTGGDRIAARKMRADYFEFTPEFKLVITGNHRPSLKSVDEAIARRLHLVPFTVTIPEAERDHQLPEKLRAEWPAILAWAIEGCLSWQRHRLNPPKSVQAATETYLATEDAFGRWIDDCCVLSPNVFGASSALFDSWKTWADRNGEYIGSQKRFVGALEVRDGLKWHRTKTARGFSGIGLRADIDKGGDGR